MDYEKIINTTGNKEFWSKYSALKKNLISALENAETNTESEEVCPYGYTHKRDWCIECDKFFKCKLEKQT